MLIWVDQLWTMSTDGSRVDNVHGWITCGKFPRVGHMWTVGHGWSTCGRKGFPLRLINQSETALQNYMVYVHVDSCGERGSKTTLFHILSTCPRVHTWLSCVITVWSHGFLCALHVLFVRREICNLLPHGFRP